MARKRTKKQGPVEAARLRPALTAEEYDLVVSAALRTLDEGGRRRILSELPVEVAAVVAEVLLGAAPTAAARPSADRVLAEWNAALRGIEDLVFETGDEDGDYLRRDEHWEPPYVDVLAFAEDLEPLAKELRSLLPRVIGEDLAPGFDPREFLAGMEEEIGSGLPEWIDPFVDDLELGPELTGFLLDHAELTAAREGGDSTGLEERAHGLDVATSHLRLDRKTLRSRLAARTELQVRAGAEGTAVRPDPPS
jgi:hypothetical protein